MKARVFCIPNSVTVKPFSSPPKPNVWPCANNEVAVRQGCVALPSTTGSPTPATTGGSPASTPRTSDTPDRDLAAYEAAITQALASNDATKLPEIRRLADRAIASLNKRIEDITYMKKETSDIRLERDRLLSVLRRIQGDYSGLLETTDDLETLRRIREQEGGAAQREQMWYLVAFLIAAVALLGVIFVMGGQKVLETAMSPSTPAMSPPLM